MPERKEEYVGKKLMLMPFEEEKERETEVKVDGQHQVRLHRELEGVIGQRLNTGLLGGD